MSSIEKNPYEENNIIMNGSVNQMLIFYLVKKGAYIFTNILSMSQ